MSPSQTGESPPPSAWGNPLTSDSERAHTNLGIPGRAVPKRFKKGRLMRWLVLYKSGGKQVLTLDKRQLIEHLRLDIPVRDMRLMDSVLGNTYDTPGQLLVREDALVLSMEYVRLIIAADKAVVALDDDKVEGKERFMMSLENSINEWNHQTHGRDPGRPLFKQSVSVDSVGDNLQSEKRHMDDDAQPFELQVLEAALREVCAYLARQAADLRATAEPVLDDLTKDSDRTNLERVRRVKTSQTQLAGRVKAIGESLEKLMDDDQDMWRMCLSLRHNQQPSAHAFDASGVLVTSPPRATSFRSMMMQNHQVGSLRRMSCRPEHSMALDPDLVVSGEMAPQFDVSDVEALLESYFIEVESTSKTLAELGEYIQDTEELISMALDWSRNKLIRFEILLTIGTFALAFFSAVASVLGENLVIPEAWTKDIMGFVFINTFAALLGLMGFCAVLITLRTQKLI